LVKQGSDLLLEIASGASGPADAIEIRLSKTSTRDASLAFGPAGWTARTQGGAILLSGPGLDRFPALFRLELGGAKIPPVARLIIRIAGETVSARDIGLGTLPPPVVSEGVEGLLVFPAIVFAGESALARVLIPNATSPFGVWEIGGATAEAVGETVRFLAPFDAEGRVELPVRYIDAWGRTVLNGVARLLAEPSPGALGRPALESVQAIALAGESLTVCGWFPPQARGGVLLDARPDLELAAGSARSLVFTLREDTPPGRHLVSGDPDAGFLTEILELETIRLDTSVDRAVNPPHVRIKVLGTRQPVRLRVVNLNPLAASLEGGESQVVESDGGAENIAMIAMRPGAIVGPGAPDLNIVFTLATPGPACEPQSNSPASSPGRPMAN
jgi:hypothetical protein